MKEATNRRHQRPYRVWAIALSSVSASLLVSCGPSGEDPEERSGPPRVSVVNYPLAYFAERIGGEHVEVLFPAPSDVDPAFWKPDEEAVARYQESDLILLNGATYAKWVPNTTLPESKIVDTTADVRDRLIEVKDAVVHAHGPAGKHSHAGTAFTTWLDPAIALAQAKAVRDALVTLSPEHEQEFAKNYESLRADLEQLDERIAAALNASGKPPVFFSHPVYQYFERAYELDGRSVHWEPEEMPDEEQWKEFDTLLAERPAKWMIWEGEPAPEIVAKLAEHGVAGVVFDPCGSAPDEGDFLSAMTANAEALTKLQTK